MEEEELEHHQQGSGINDEEQQPSQIDSIEEERIVSVTQSYDEKHHSPLMISQSPIRSTEEKKTGEQPETDDSVQGSQFVVDAHAIGDEQPSMVTEDVSVTVVDKAVEAMDEIHNAEEPPSVIVEEVAPPALVAEEEATSVGCENAQEEAILITEDATTDVVHLSEDVPSGIYEDAPFVIMGEAATTESLFDMAMEEALPEISQDTPFVITGEAATTESLLDMEMEEAPPKISEEALPLAVQNVPPEFAQGVEDALPKVVEDALPKAAEDTASVVVEDATPIVAEDAPAVVVEAALPKAAQDAPPMAAEDAPAVVVKDAPPMAAEDAPPMAAEDALPEAAQDTPSVIVEVATPLVAEDAPAVVVEDAIPMVAEDTPAVVVEVATPMVAEDAHTVVARDAIPMVAEDTPAVVVEVTTPMVAEDAHTVVARDATPKIENASSAVVENASTVSAKDDSTMIGDDETLVVNETVSCMAAEEVAHASEVDTEMEMEAEMVESGTGGKKRKRGRPPKVQAKAPLPKVTEEEEDVCFICFDGGNLVLCDRRGCPKAYHPVCVNRDEAFFRSRGRWNCGWHICSNCEKGANYMCYTCTYSLCKGCIKEADFACVRGNKGFCETCMRTVMLIEKNEQAQVNFDDKSSWEYLFKEYWLDLKGKQSLTLDELTQAKNPFKGSNILARKGDSSEELYDANDDKGSDSDGSTGHVEVSNSRKRKPKKQSKLPKEDEPPRTTYSEGTSPSSDAEWASKDLLDFVGHMKNGDKSPLSQFDVQALFLDYIKINNLRDPRKKSQIVCDSRLENLFGKARVGHFEMLKLLESHFFLKEDSDDIQRATADSEGNQLDSDGTPGSLTRSSSDKRRKSRRKGDGRGPQTNLDDYAAIDVNNIKLLYLRRNLMEDLLEDSDKFHDRVSGSFVRIRISGSGQKQDMYRLVQVIGTRKAAEPYKTGKRSADVVLEILNLNKSEAISIDTISNQDFTEDECKRLRQSIKCGLIPRMSVGEVQEKAIALQAVRVNDWLETEKLRISHLRDRASEQGRRKDLRECVEKLQLLNTPEERSRRLHEIPQVHADPKMDPNYISDEEDEQDDRSQDNGGGGVTPRDSGFTRTARDPISPGKSPASLDTWSGSRKSSGSESGRNISVRERSYNGGGSESVSDDPHHLSNSWDAPKNLAPTFASTTVTELPPAPPAPLVVPSINETDKMWYYQDPSKKTQGPFSMVQLRKWSTTGHFPVDHRIWRTTESQQDSILLTDALLGKYVKDVPPPPAVTPTNHRNDRTIANTSSWADQNRTSHSNWDMSGYANGNDASAGGWSSPTPDSGRGGSWGDARANTTNSWGGRSSYSAQPQRSAFNQGGHRGGGGGGRWSHRDQNRGGNNWNSNKQNYNRGGGQPYNINNNSGRGGSSWGDNSSRGGWGNNIEPPKPVVTEGWGNRNNNISNFPSPTPPNTSNSGWNTEQWSPTPGAAGNNGGWGQRPAPIMLPNQVLGDYSSPPTPTPPPAGNYVHPH